MVDLLPCPFCGCQGQEFKDFWDSGQIDCFGCKDCGISFERADEWNRRETPPQPASAETAMSEHLSLDWAVEIIGMCEPIRCHQGGMWFSRNHNFADAAFIDYGAANAFAVAAKALPELVRALKEIEDLGANGVTAARLGNIAHAALIAARDPVGQTQGSGK